MKRYFWLIGMVIGLGGTLLSGCTQSQAGITPTTTVFPVTASPGSAGGTSVPPITATPSLSQTLAKKAADQLGLPMEAVQVMELQPAEWPDACLGVPKGAEVCATVITPGYRGVLITEKGRYELRSDQSGAVVRLIPEGDVSGSPVTNVGVMWEGSWDSDCQTAVLGSDALAVGPCKGELSNGRYALPERAPRLAYFVQTFASFEAQTPAGKVQFLGKGSAIASPVEQRMIAEWARIAAEEVSVGGAAKTQGTALTWHREGGIAGFCEDLTIFVNGEAHLASCKTQGTAALGTRYLTAAQLERLYGWLDRLQPFDFKQSDPAVADAMTITLTFKGVGAQAATDAEQADIAAFAAEVFAMPEEMGRMEERKMEGGRAEK